MVEKEIDGREERDEKLREPDGRKRRETATAMGGEINTKIGSERKILEKQVRCKCVLGIIQFTFTHLQQKKYVQK